MNPNTTCCLPRVVKRQEKDFVTKVIDNKRMGKEEAAIFEKALNVDQLPESLQNASDYIKELVQRTGRLMNIFFQEKCAQKNTTRKFHLLPQLAFHSVGTN